LYAAADSTPTVISDIAVEHLIEIVH